MVPLVPTYKFINLLFYFILFIHFISLSYEKVAKNYARRKHNHCDLQS